MAQDATVWVGNTCGLLEDQIRSAFHQFGDVVSCKAYDGYAFVTFRDPVSAQSAVSQRAVHTCGIALKVDRTRGSQRDRGRGRRGGYRGFVEERQVDEQEPIGGNNRGRGPRGEHGRGRWPRRGRGERRACANVYARASGGNRGFPDESSPLPPDDDDDDNNDEAATEGAEIQSNYCQFLTSSINGISPENFKIEVNLALKTATIVASSMQVLHCTQTELRVLITMDLQKTADLKKDLLFKVLQEPSKMMIEEFTKRCLLDLKRIVSGFKWTIELCNWNRQEKIEAIKRSDNFLQSQLSPSQLPPKISPFQKSSSISYQASRKSIHQRYHERPKVSLKRADIEIPLTRETYKDKFTNLLIWEENEHIVVLREKCDGRYDVSLSLGSGKGYIEMDADRVAYVVQASDGTATVSVERGTNIGDVLIQEEVELHVQFKQDYSSFERLNFELEESEHGELRSCVNAKHSCKDVSVRAKVEFELKHSYFDTLQKSVSQMSAETVLRVLPGSNDFPAFQKCHLSPLLDHYLKECSDDQRNALGLMLSLPTNSPPFLVKGAFGTGKTYLLAATIHCLFEETGGRPVRVLVCTQQHVSGTTFLECFHDKFLIKPHEDLEVIKVVPSTFKPAYNKPYELTPDDLRPRMHNLERKSKLLVVTTCNSSSHLSSLKGFFTHIFIDEGAQLREPEAITPLQLTGRDTRIIIAGDEHQVGPNLLVFGEAARECGLKFSILERLHNLYLTYGKTKQYEAVLSINHRSHPNILSFVDMLFYKCGLRSVVRSHCTHPKAAYPLVFVCSSVDESLCQVESNVDEGEANVLLEQAKMYAASWPEDTWGKVDYSQLCIVSISRGQLSFIEKKAKARFPPQMRHISRLPTFDIQGRQYRAVFVSTWEPTMVSDGLVSSCNPTKSMSDRFVFNTVMTRAQSLVVCVGNPFLLLKLEQSMMKRYGDAGRCWSHYLKTCIDHKTLDWNGNYSVNAATNLNRRIDSILHLTST